jgi:hypothetical protein
MMLALNTYRVPVGLTPRLGHTKVYVAAPDPTTAKAMAAAVVARAFPTVYGVEPERVRAISATLYEPSRRHTPSIISVELYAEGEIPYQD